VLTVLRCWRCWGAGSAGPSVTAILKRVHISARRLGLLRSAIAAACLVALATLPFGHHDLVCHLKSSTHCTTCLVGTSADDTSAQPAVPIIVLADAGRPDDPSRSNPDSCVPDSSSGRSPPTFQVSA
jgi:hypothetical protein